MAINHKELIRRLARECKRPLNNAEVRDVLAYNDTDCAAVPPVGDPEAFDLYERLSR